MQDPRLPTGEGGTTRGGRGTERASTTDGSRLSCNRRLKSEDPGAATHTCRTVGQAPPEDNEWVYELKFDGYRGLILKDHDRVEIRSRKNKDLTRMYPRVAAADLKLNA